MNTISLGGNVTGRIPKREVLSFGLEGCREETRKNKKDQVGVA